MVFYIFTYLSTCHPYILFWQARQLPGPEATRMGHTPRAQPVAVDAGNLKLLMKRKKL
jgi:hypothetical protein